MSALEPPPPYTERPQTYEATPLMRPARQPPARQPPRRPQQDMTLDGFDRISKTEFSVIAGIWCVGVTACCYFCCKP